MLLLKKLHGPIHVNNLGAAAIHLLRWRDSPLLVGQGREGNFFPWICIAADMVIHPNSMRHCYTAALSSQRSRGAGMYFHKLCCIFLPETENCPGVKEGSELKHSVWKLKGLAAVIFFFKVPMEQDVRL